MKINESHIPPIRSIIALTDSSIIYREPKNRLDETWDALAKYYTKKEEELNLDAISTIKLYNTIQQARVELETGKKTFDLINEKIITKQSVSNEEIITEKKNNLKYFIIEELKRIISKSKNMLEDAIKLERKVWGISKGYDARIYNGEIRIYFDDTHYACINNKGELEYYESWKSKELLCIIKYEKFSFKGRCKYESSTDTLSTLQLYFRDQRCKGEFSRGNLRVSIVEAEFSEEYKSDDICLFFLEGLRRYKSVDELMDCVLFYLSHFIIKLILSPVCKIIDKGFIKELDGMSNEFYCIGSKNIIHVKRNIKKGIIEFYLNDEKINFK
ncbi:hypothetical protein TCON_2506 [Astathelohania contejeani]|uniref:Uncharacterized protein n=1 Tax=Astathelohania contejeani TaxID=164912 RepID=A0ABQ7HVU2_9MICR|nr:hypothetical protein TCON_2506 [Thelohania contejeani]